MSVDLYVEQVIAGARCVVIRLLGGLDYWRYGAEEIAHAARAQGIPLALLPGDGRDDARLAELSTVDGATLARLDAFFAAGGPENMRRALDVMAHLAGLAPDHGLAAEPLPMHGVHRLDVPDVPGRPLAVIVFYRAYLLAADLAPIEALARALDQEGLNVRALYVASLKDRDTGDFVASHLARLEPRRSCSTPPPSPRASTMRRRLSKLPARRSCKSCSPDRAAKPGRTRRAGFRNRTSPCKWCCPSSTGGCSPRRSPSRPRRARSQASNSPASRISQRQKASPPLRAARRCGRGSPPRRAPSASSRSCCPTIPARQGKPPTPWASTPSPAPPRSCGCSRSEGFDVGDTLPDNASLVAELCDAEPTPFLSLADYKRLFATLDAEARAKIVAAWGAPDDDPSVRDGHFTMRFARHGRLIAAIQPDRGNALDRKSSYHDPDLPPRHAYVAFYLWLREAKRIHAMIHLGTHGTLEWLPGKAMALSSSCLPAALLGGLPVIYPFIVNNPGEAAAAKRRLGAVTIGHLTPPLKSAGHGNDTLELERLIDEYAAADGLDRRRTALLREEILDRAGAAGLLAESGADRASSKEDQLARLDAYLCDVKDLQIRDGLHVYGRAPDAQRREEFLASLAQSNPQVPAETLAARFDQAAAREREALITALDGKFVAPGPSGAPTRGRADVLPTGRNLYAIDPRAVPTRSAVVLAEKAAKELLRRHLQDHGECPRALVMDVWGSATMRTGGEDLALALLLMGARPVWDQGSARVSGIEILPIAELDHPRVDVTLRISGLFRDAFEAQIALFDEAVRAIAARDEPDDWNPLAAVRARAAGRGVAARHRAHLWRGARRLRSRRHRARRAWRLGPSAPISASIISPPLRPPTAKASTVSPTATALPRA